MTSVEYLNLDDLLDMVEALGVGPIRDVGLLESAVARPRARAFGQDAYGDLALKAAALLHSVALNHALVDGNKRLAWLATHAFLRINGHRPNVTNSEAFALVMDVVQGTAALDATASRLRVQPVAVGGPGPVSGS